MNTASLELLLSFPTKLGAGPGSPSPQGDHFLLLAFPIGILVGFLLVFTHPRYRDKKPIPKVLWSIGSGIGLAFLGLIAKDVLQMIYSG